MTTRTVSRLSLAAALAAGALLPACNSGDCSEGDEYACYADTDRCFCSYLCTSDMAREAECTPTECHRDEGLDAECTDYGAPMRYGWTCDTYPGALCAALDSSMQRFCCSRSTE